MRVEPRYRRPRVFSWLAPVAAVTLSSMAATHAGEDDWCLNPGPDVVVRDIFDSYSYGSVGDRAAFAVGTDACNIGDEVVNWFGETEDHPVIASSAYRLHDGRFEQIGMAWLKHGFGAAQDDTCGCDCVPADWTHLGVGCSDAYNASTNGIQGISGSRLEVNPWTGVFPFPPQGWGESGNTIFRRLQVAHADLDPNTNPGAQYFVETHYVLPHDASAGNQRNNYSTRPVSFVQFGASWSMVLEGETLAGQPALLMWQELDPEVVLVEVEMPGEGRLLVGCRVYEEAEGWYRFEYAIQNLDNARGVRSIRIPHSQWASVEGLAFSDVDYHSGDPVIGTDWSIVVADQALTWSTDEWFVDPLANAIRWGTTYSFGFRTNTEPVEGSLELKFFSLGVLAGVEIEIPVPRVEGIDPCGLPPGSCPNDVDGDLVVGVTDLLVILGHFGQCGDGTWQPPGDIDMDCCVTVDDVLALIGGWGQDCHPIGACCLQTGGCMDGLRELDCVTLGGSWRGPDTECMDANCPEVGGCCLSDGSCVEDLLPEECADMGGIHLPGGADCTACPLMADDCADADIVTEGEYAFDTRNATTDGPIHPECDTFDGGYTGNDIWMKYTATATGTLILSTCSTADYDSDLVIYDGVDCENLVLLGCNDDTEGCAGFTSYLEVPVQDEGQYLIRLGGWQETHVGNGTLAITLQDPVLGACCLDEGSCLDWIEQGPCNAAGGAWGGVDSNCSDFLCAPANDDCIKASVIEDGLYLFDTRQATTDGPIHPECDTSDGGVTGNDIWFRYTPVADGILELSTCSTADYDTDLVVYDGNDCEALVLLGCNDDTKGCEGWTSWLQVPVQAGSAYLVRLGGWVEGSVGTGFLQVSLMP